MHVCEPACTRCVALCACMCASMHACISVHMRCVRWWVHSACMCALCGCGCTAHTCVRTHAFVAWPGLACRAGRALPYIASVARVRAVLWCIVLRDLPELRVCVRAWTCACVPCRARCAGMGACICCVRPRVHCCACALWVHDEQTTHVVSCAEHDNDVKKVDCVDGMIDDREPAVHGQVFRRVFRHGWTCSCEWVYA